MKANAVFNKAILYSAIASALTMTSSTALANNVDGSIRGVVTDKISQQPISGATITIANDENGYSRVLTADLDGTFNLKSIPVGEYDITVKLNGYQTESIEDLTVGIGKASAIEVSLTEGNIEVISVSGARISSVDVTSAEASFNISMDELSRLPVAADVTSVALLAPGVNLGDDRFTDAKGNSLASFGGSSQAENVYYVNGLNLTNFRNGVGGASLPFLAYDSFQVKTGGYSAEFGRATGGVISAVTKKGDNEFKFGVEHRQDLGGLRGDSPNTYYTSENGCTGTGAEKECRIHIGDTYIDNSQDERDHRRTNVYASGALIEDELFFYGLYQFRERTSQGLATASTDLVNYNDDDPYYIARLDWNINDDHSLMAWVFNDESQEVETRTSFDSNGNITNERISTTDTGGKSWSIRYNGLITDDLSVSAMFGKVKFRENEGTIRPDCPFVQDRTSGSRVNLGCADSSSSIMLEEEREQIRVDFDWYLNDSHNLRFGIDTESNIADASRKYNGADNIFYRVTSFDAGAKLSSGHVLDKETNVIEEIRYGFKGTYEIENTAIYLEDVWTVTDKLTATIGLRWESFENKNAEGVSFVKIDDQIAPRLGLAYDIFGDGDHKLFLNYGHYHIPVAANTNIRYAGLNPYVFSFYEFKGFENNEYSKPIRGEYYGFSRSGAGSQTDPTPAGDAVSDPSTLAHLDLEPMYQEEIMIGYQGKINEDWSWGVKFTHRDVKSIIDDGYMKYGLASNPNNTDTYHSILFNPGKDVRFMFDGDQDGVLEEHNYTAEQLGYPEAVRKYNAVDLMLERAWDGKWMFKANYTWAQNYGNAEGYVKSDNGQDDAGLTTDWDYPYLMDGAYGYLPNDRRHSLKLFGSYAITDNLAIGMNANITSGRPLSAYGQGHPTADYSYGDTYWVGDKLTTRGTFGRTDWTSTFNLNVKYTLPEMDFVESGSIALNVYNIFDAAGVLYREENAERDRAAGNVEPAFMLPTAYQSPRRVEFTLNLNF